MRTTEQRLLVLAEVTLTAVTVVAAVNLGRLFEDGTFLTPVIVSTLLAHGLAVTCRRLRLAPALTTLLAIVGLLLVLTWTQLGETTTLLLPTGRTLTAFRSEVRDAWRVFGDVVAPAPVLPGFVLMAALGAWIIAFISDAAAFRARARVEAVIPAATLFVFGGALGTADHRLLLSALFCGAVAVHWLSQRVLSQLSSPTWLASPSGARAHTLLRAGVTVAVLGVVAAVVVGPNLPGATAKAAVPWRASDRQHDDSRVTISPLVDIRRRLVDQSNVVVFRVQSDRRAYWRLTSLERFDGRIWSSNRQYQDADGVLDAGVATGRASSVTSVATFDIEGLSSIWLPAPFRAVKVAGTAASYDDDSNSLLSSTDTAKGLSYTVLSQIPQLSADELGTVTSRSPERVAQEYTALPFDFSPAVQQLAVRLTRRAATPYAKAKALQDYFRSGAFTYDLDAPAGHSGRDLEDFLFRTRRGYCEQFAGAYAAMARAIGLPARVGVGFTPGELDAATGAYVVHGFNAHAWPEVYLDGFGWVAFEPTPGRGMPGAQSYTGLPEQQAQAGNPSTATTLAPTTTAPASGSPTTTTTTASTATPGAPTQQASSPWPKRVAAVAAVVLVGPLAWVALLAVLRIRRRRRRRAGATSAEQRVLVAWDEVAEALARAGTPLHPWETPSEYAVRVGGTTPLDLNELRGLAGLTTSAAYAAAPLPDAVAEQATEVAHRLEDEADALLSRGTRIRRAIDPRDLRRERAPRVDVRSG